MSAPKPRTRFAIQSRILHWLMAVMILTMLFIGVADGGFARGLPTVLVAIHRPLGIAVLILAVIRLINRKLTKLPPFPPTMSKLERFIASSSEKLLLRLDDHTAASRLGYALCGPLSDRDVWDCASTSHPPGPSDALCLPAP